MFPFIKNEDVSSYSDDTKPYEAAGNYAYVMHNF